MARAARCRRGGRRALRPPGKDWKECAGAARRESALTPVAWVLLAATALVAAADWFAVATSRRRLEYLAKPVVMVGLVAVAATLEPVSHVERLFFVAALALGLLSDVFLMLPRDMFLAGLVAALVEHVAYIAGFRARDFDFLSFTAGALIAVLSVIAFLPPILRALRRSRPALVLPVIAYVAVFIFMVASAG